MVLGPSHDPGLLGSYARAWEALECTVIRWDFHGCVEEHQRFGRLSRLVNPFLGPEKPIHAANRDLVLQIRSAKPDILVAAGMAPIRAGPLGQARIAEPHLMTALLWPDTLVNLDRNIIECLPLLDVVATYSNASIPIFRSLGARRVIWTPFASDPDAFPADVAISPSERTELECDVSFIGNHRPERERDVLALLDAGFRVKVWGTKDWERRAVHRDRLVEYWQGGPRLNHEFSKAVKSSKLSLNRIDDTNFPAANMRFFELMSCGAAALHSECPEMIGAFPEGELAFYYGSGNLVARVRELIGDPDRRMTVTLRAHELVMREHTYKHRARDVLSALGFASPRPPRPPE